jgi:hypothetical protein
MVQEPVQEAGCTAGGRASGAGRGHVVPVGVVFYGGYFGAGIGILMLAALGKLGHWTSTR